MIGDLAAFVRARFVEELEKAHFAGNVVVKQPASFGVEPEDAASTPVSPSPPLKRASRCSTTPWCLSLIHI